MSHYCCILVAFSPPGKSGKNVPAARAWKRSGGNSLSEYSNKLLHFGTNWDTRARSVLGSMTSGPRCCQPVWCSTWLAARPLHTAGRPMPRRAQGQPKCTAIAQARYFCGGHAQGNPQRTREGCKNATSVITHQMQRRVCRAFGTMLNGGIELGATPYLEHDIGYPATHILN